MTENKEKIEELAQKVQLLFPFLFDLGKDIDLLERVAKHSDEMVDRTMSMAPIIGAFGENYEELEFEARLKQKRGEALFKLVKVIIDTEAERIEFKEKQKAKAEGREQLRSILGY